MNTKQKHWHGFCPSTGAEARLFLDVNGFGYFVDCIESNISFRKSFGSKVEAKAFYNKHLKRLKDKYTA